MPSFSSGEEERLFSVMGRDPDIACLMLQELPCGHFMHSHCFAQYTRFNYSCPVCSKSMGDMSIYFGMLDSIVARDLAGLPPAYRARQQVRQPFPAAFFFCSFKGV